MSREIPPLSFRINTLDECVQHNIPQPNPCPPITRRPLASLSELDEYSRSFLDVLLQHFPQWRSAARIAECDGVISLWLEIAAPSAAFGSLWISTEYGEVTVGVGSYHTHFATYEPATDQDAFRQATEFIGDLISERLVLALAMKGECYCCGWVQFPGSTIEAPASTLGVADRVVLRSWNASIDRELAVTGR